MELPLSASSSVKTPMARQMASAVSLLSPVMTTTRMPAAWQSSIAVRTCSSGTSSAIVKRELADVTTSTTTANADGASQWSSTRHGSRLVPASQEHRRRAHLGPRRVLQAGQAQEGEVALDGGVLCRVCQPPVPAVRLAAVIVGQIAQVGLDGKGQQAQRTAGKLIKPPAGAGRRSCSRLRKEEHWAGNGCHSREINDRCDAACM